MKKVFITSAGVVGSVIASFLGGWDNALQTLVMFMAVDYFSGVAVAGIFHASTKTESGGLSSLIGAKGLMKKVMILVMVAIGHRLDLLFMVDYMRIGVCFAFIANELISIVENAGLMGLPIPAVITKAIDVLNNHSEPGEM